MYIVSYLTLLIKYVATYLHFMHVLHMPLYIERSMTLSPKSVIKKFNVELLQKLPLDDEIFFGMAKKVNLFPGDNADSIEALPTRAKKVAHFLQHVVEPGAEVYLPKLLEVMKQYDDNTKDLADEIEAEMKPGTMLISKICMQLHNHSGHIII